MNSDTNFNNKNTNSHYFPQHQSPQLQPQQQSPQQNSNQSQDRNRLTKERLNYLLDNFLIGLDAHNKHSLLDKKEPTLENFNRHLQAPETKKENFDSALVQEVFNSRIKPQQTSNALSPPPFQPMGDQFQGQQPYQQQTQESPNTASAAAAAGGYGDPNEYNQKLLTPASTITTASAAASSRNQIQQPQIKQPQYYSWEKYLPSFKAEFFLNWLENGQNNGLEKDHPGLVKYIKSNLIQSNATEKSLEIIFSEWAEKAAKKGLLSQKELPLIKRKIQELFSPTSASSAPSNASSGFFSWLGSILPTSRAPATNLRAPAANLTAKKGASIENLPQGIIETNRPFSSPAVRCYSSEGSVEIATSIPHEEQQRSSVLIAANAGLPLGGIGRAIEENKLDQSEVDKLKLAKTHEEAVGARLGLAPLKNAYTLLKPLYGLKDGPTATGTLTHQGHDYTENCKHLRDGGAYRYRHCYLLDGAEFKNDKNETLYTGELAFAYAPNAGATGKSGNTSTMTRTLDPNAVASYEVFREGIKHAYRSFFDSMLDEKKTIAIMVKLGCGIYAGNHAATINNEIFTIVEEVLQETRPGWSNPREYYLKTIIWPKTQNPNPTTQASATSAASS